MNELTKGGMFFNERVRRTSTWNAFMDNKNISSWGYRLSRYLLTRQFAPDSISSCSQFGVVSPLRNARLTSKTACGKRVISVRDRGTDGSRCQRSLSSGFSLIIQIFVSSFILTVGSKGICTQYQHTMWLNPQRRIATCYYLVLTWKNVRIYCVLIVGFNCFASIIFCTSLKSAMNLSISSWEKLCKQGKHGTIVVGKCRIEASFHAVAQFC